MIFSLLGILCLFFPVIHFSPILLPYCAPESLLGTRESAGTKMNYLHILLNLLLSAVLLLFLPRGLKPSVRLPFAASKLSLHSHTLMASKRKCINAQF